MNVTHLDSDRKYMISKLSLDKNSTQGANVLDFYYVNNGGKGSMITVEEYFKIVHKIQLT